MFRSVVGQERPKGTLQGMFVSSPATFRSTPRSYQTRRTHVRSIRNVARSDEEVSSVLWRGPNGADDGGEDGVNWSKDRSMFKKESGLSPADRLELYAIDEPADHERAASFALKHVRTLETFLARRPVAKFNRDAFDTVETIRREQFAGKKIILDAGCGTGMSTDIIARQNPDHLVVGVDRSAARISKGKTKAEPAPNFVIVRADLVDLWRLALEKKWTVAKQFLLYPNPYPLKADLKKRWHGHPSFPLLLLLGGEIEVRGSWRGYLEEFATSVRTILDDRDASDALGLRHESVQIESVETLASTIKYISLFERKYALSGMPVYRLLVRMNS